MWAAVHVPLGTCFPLVFTVIPALRARVFGLIPTTDWCVFLSNRTYPDAWVNKLSKPEIREHIRGSALQGIDATGPR